jgi:hypothetical protein
LIKELETLEKTTPEFHALCVRLAEVTTSVTLSKENSQRILKKFDVKELSTYYNDKPCYCDHSGDLFDINAEALSFHAKNLLNGYVIFEIPNTKATFAAGVFNGFVKKMATSLYMGIYEHIVDILIKIDLPDQNEAYFECYERILYNSKHFVKLYSSL